MRHSTVCSRYKHNASFVTRLPTIRRPKVPHPTTYKIAMAPANVAGCAISGHVHEANDCVPTNGLNRKLFTDSGRNSSGIFFFSLQYLVYYQPISLSIHRSVIWLLLFLSLEDEEEHHIRYIQLTPQYRMAIRAIRKVSVYSQRVDRWKKKIENRKWSSSMVIPNWFFCLSVWNKTTVDKSVDL